MEIALTSLLLSADASSSTTFTAARAISEVIRSARSRFSRHISTVKEFYQNYPISAVVKACIALADAAANSESDEYTTGAARVSLDLVLRALAELPKDRNLHRQPEMSVLFEKLIDTRAACDADVFISAALRLVTAEVAPNDAATLVESTAPSLIATLCNAAQIDTSDLFRKAADAVVFNENAAAARRDALRRLCVFAKLALTLAVPLKESDALILAAAAVLQNTSSTLTEDIAEAMLPRTSAAFVLRTAIARTTGRAAQQLEAALVRVTAVTTTAAAAPTNTIASPSLVPAALVSAIFGERRTVFTRPGRPLRRPTGRVDEIDSDAAASTLTSLLAQGRSPLDAVTAARSAAYAEVSHWRVRSVRHAVLALRDIPLAIVFCGVHEGTQRALVNALVGARRFTEARGAAHTLAREGRMSSELLCESLESIAMAELTAGVPVSSTTSNIPSPVGGIDGGSGSKRPFWTPLVTLMGQEVLDNNNDLSAVVIDDNNVDGRATITLVNTAAGARAMSSAIIKAAHVQGKDENSLFYVGLDAEWRPSTLRVQSANVESLSSFDIASSGGGGGGGDGRTPVAVLQLATCHQVWVIDVRTLRYDPALPTALISALCKSNVVVTGCGVNADLERLIRTLPLLRGTRFKSLDLSLLSRARGASGLSAVTERFLGAPLDKTLQTSDWAARPLSWEQIRYAALDALAAARCMAVARVDDLSIPLPTPNSSVNFEENAIVDEDTDASDLTLARLVGAPAVADSLTLSGLDASRILHLRNTNFGYAGVNSVNAVTTEIKTLVLITAQDALVIALLPLHARLNFARAALVLKCGTLRLAARIDECAARCGFEPGVIPPVGFSTRTLLTLIESSIVSSTSGQILAGGGDKSFLTLFACADELLAAITNPIVADICDTSTAVSGEIYESSLIRPPSALTTTTTTTSISTTEVIEKDIPYFDIPRIRFVVDSSLNRLTRWLRAIGCDTEARDGIGALEWRASTAGQNVVVSSSSSSSNLSVDELISYANAERRIILTRDSKTLSRRETAVIFWVEDADIQVAFTAVCEAFAIYVRPSDLMSRCSQCNGGEYVQVSPAQVRAQGGGGISETLLNRLQYFWKCTRCEKLYWEGGKFEESRLKFSELFHNKEDTAAEEE